MADGSTPAEQIEATRRYMARHYGRQYSQGGILPYATRTADGFGELEPEPATAPGSVTGYRWWTLPAPPGFRFSPACAEDIWPHASLHGQRAPWLPGVNQATCLSGLARHGPGEIPVRSCGCGFWAYWHPQDRRLNGIGQLQVFGVIKGFGRTRIGTHGFRCAKARILAVHLPFTLAPFTNENLLFARPSRQVTVSRTVNDGRTLLFPAGFTREQVQRAVDHAEAWFAVIGDRIEQDNPGVTVCETRDALLTRFPPDKVYGSQFRPAPGVTLVSHGGFFGPDAFRTVSGGELPVVSVTRMPPELAARDIVPPLAGEPGFGGDTDPPFAAGSVTGYRWWAITDIDLSAVPAAACPRCGRVTHSPDDVRAGYCGNCRYWTYPPGPPAPYNPGPLRGMHAAWQPGENTAVCLARTSTHGTATVPDSRCFCGFYAFWTLPPPYSLLSSPGLIPVCGVIEGYGKVLIGSKGFRCARARVLALHVPDAGLPPDLHEGVNAALELVLPAVRVCRRAGDMTAEYPSSRPGA